MARLFQWLALLAAPLLLSSCFLAPAKFVSTLDIRADRSFTYTYVGEVILPKTDKPADPDGDPEGFEEQGGDGGEAEYYKLAAKAKPKANVPGPDENFGDSDEEATQLRDLVKTLSAEYGYRSVRYIGNRKLAIDYQVRGTLDHAFIFPFNPDGEVFVPFIAIELRGKDRLRVKAPGFANGAPEVNPMGSGMGGGMGSAGGRNTELDGSFTITSNAEIVSQNQEDGAQTQPDGSKKIVWTVNPNTRDAPMAVLKVSALP